MTYPTFYNVLTNNSMEVMEIHDSMLIYEECNLHYIVIESSSQVLIFMLHGVIVPIGGFQALGGISCDATLEPSHNSSEKGTIH